MRIFALSDIHVDYTQNMVWLDNISTTAYKNDTLILAGDVCHDITKFQTALAMVRARFARVFFVPGNHDLWVHKTEFKDSMEKFWHILMLCQSLEVMTMPARVGDSGSTGGAWIVPLFSWYVKPGESTETLYLARPGEDTALVSWTDNYFIKWPQFQDGDGAAGHFLKLNERHLRRYDTTVISFSHFLPRHELMFPTATEKLNRSALKQPDRWFNFSRVAGCTGIEQQVRQLGSAIHIYGHQHRNREVLLDGVRYLSHCLGYPGERENGQIRGIETGIRLVWDGEKE